MYIVYRAGLHKHSYRKESEGHSQENVEKEGVHVNLESALWRFFVNLHYF